MDIIKINGTDRKLYELVAPLVMNPAILRQNNNYPFKTSLRYRWFIALDNDGSVAGFLPVRNTTGRPYIDNYYICGDREDTIERLLNAAKEEPEYERTLTALVHKRHVAAFEKNGFTSFLEWKKYHKMIITERHDTTT
ncbi:hypothetical protein [Parabacteroides johnsonii]|jgi:hypothetical protein|uniref:hypothetical protein n=2 Tax=Parabacteroides johnsonii TaxID=387661 RepID=UPI001C8C8FD5|nr:hypothetical protein [Parabacteroides johnsonii]MBX9111732.1 hypothetical protein [Parabacteroides johnsonii]